MLTRRRFLIGLLPLGIAGCTTHDAFRIAGSVARGNRIDTALASHAKNKAVGWVTNPTALKGDLKSIEQFVSQVGSVWGEEGDKPEPKRFVKYTDHYNQKSLVSFETGKVRVGALNRSGLHQVIVNTLLFPEDPTGVDLLSDQEVKLGAEPFLINQVIDHEGRSIRWAWRANRYADYLISRQLKSRRIVGEDGEHREEYFVEFALADNHQQLRKYRYAAYVDKHARKYHLDPALVYAIIETESSFNPYAVSWVPAYGLMQIVPVTAGRDAYEFIHGRPGTPSREYLFNINNNIRMGCAYLHLLDNRYLTGIKQRKSKEYCVIAAYNGGAGNVLRSFSSDRRRAIDRINQLTPRQVWDELRRNMPDESKRYLVKVTDARKRYG